VTKKKLSIENFGLRRERVKDGVVSCGVVTCVYANFHSVGRDLTLIRTEHGCPAYRAHIGAIIAHLHLN